VKAPFNLLRWWRRHGRFQLARDLLLASRVALWSALAGLFAGLFLRGCHLVQQLIPSP
jgi:hypothetical protein